MERALPAKTHSRGRYREGHSAAQPLFALRWRSRSACEPFVGPVGQYKDYWQGIHAGISDYLPSYFSSIERLIRDGHYPIDVAILSLSEPNEQGYCTMGVSCSYQRTAMRSAKIVIGQINKQMPRIFGETSVHVSELDYIIEVDEPLPVIPNSSARSANTAPRSSKMVRPFKQASASCRTRFSMR